MNNVIKAIKILTLSIIHLKNWSIFFTNFVLYALNKKTIKFSNLLKLRNGINLKIHDNASIVYKVFSDIYLKEVYEMDNIFKLNDTDTVIDIGANIGFFSVKAAKLCKNGKVFSFEALSLHYNLLKENINQNNCSNVKAFHEAVWKENTEIDFLYSIDGEPQNTSIYNVGGTINEKVKATSLDNIFKREDIIKCDFMKLDCEGAEYEILYNSNKETLDKIKKISMEIHSFNKDQKPNEMIKFLQDNGFTIHPKSRKSNEFIYAYR